MKIKHIATLNFCVFVSSRLLTWAKRVSQAPASRPARSFWISKPLGYSLEAPVAHEQSEFDENGDSISWLGKDRTFIPGFKSRV